MEELNTQYVKCSQKGYSLSFKLAVVVKEMEGGFVSHLLNKLRGLAPENEISLLIYVLSLLSDSNNCDDMICLI